MTTEPATIVDVLRGRAARTPERDAYAFLPDGRTETARLAFADVDRRARAIATALLDRARPGDRVLIIYPAESGLEYVTGFLGCLYAGMVAVPCDAQVGRSGAERLAWISQDAEPALILGPASAGVQQAGVPVVDVAALPDDLAADYRDRTLSPERIALLQYTSGSTRRPRGVMVGHSNIMANERAIKSTCEHDGDSTFVGWLPLFHDMGLIANVLQPLYLGSLSVLMPPTAFLADPLCWPEAISRYRGVTSGGPNFAYDLCAGRAQPDLDLDLSTWRVAFNGAEVVRSATLRRFLAAFGPHGFTPETFFPCYGLAEATLIVTGAPRGIPPRRLRADPDALRGGRLVPADDARAQTLVSSGRLAGDARVEIIDPDSGATVADGVFGEVCVSGGSVAQGYWRRPDESAAVFTATDTGTVLRTGDIGALADGELYLVGRLKDMVVIRGQNLYPDDIEWAAERAHRALRPSCGAAFALEDGEHERLALVYEIAPGADGVDIADVGAAVRAAVADRHGVEPHLIALVRRGSVPKTTSGKVRRSGCRAAWTAGTLPVVAVSALDDPGGSSVDRAEARIEHALADSAAAAHALALDSLAATELGHRIERRHGIRLPLHLLLGPVTTRSVAAAIAQRRSDVPAHDRDDSDPNVGPLLPTQAALWFEDQLAAGSPAYHLVRAVEIRGRLDRAAFTRALDGLIDAHPALRTGFAERGDAVVQLVGARSAVVIEDMPGPGSVAERLRVETGRPFALHGQVAARFTVLRHGPEHHTLIVAAHHAVADFWSLTVIVGDLFTRYAREAGADAPSARVPDRTPISHARRCAELAKGSAGSALRQYWGRRLDGAPSVLPLPTDHPRPGTRSFRGEVLPLAVSPDATGRLRALAREHGTTLFAAAFAGFQLLMSRLTGERDLVIGTIVHGRDHADLADVVGCLVNLVPIRGGVSSGTTFAALVARTGRDLRSDLANAGLPFTDIVRLHDSRRQPGTPTLVQVLAVFHAEPGGLARGLTALALGRAGPLNVPGELDVRALDVHHRWTHMDLTLNLAEIDGALAGTLEYNPDLFHRDTVARLAECLTVLLDTAASRPRTAVGRLPLLTADHLGTALRAGSGPPVVRETNQTVHGLVLDQARRTPDAVAVAARGIGGCAEQLTYRALARWATGVASRLLEHGLRAEEPVAVVLERGAAVPVAALGVMLAGGAYLPIDPADPPDRLRGALEDAGVRVVLTRGPGLAALPSGATVLDLGECRTRACRPIPPVHPDQLAYVIYTSGSTGNPKGVAVAHRAIVNRLLWMQEEFALDARDRVAHKTPATFDVSLWELFWPLTTGACLVAVPPGAHLDPGPLARALTEHQITTAHFVPTMLRGFLADDGPLDPRALTRVICSGEKLPAPLADRAARRLHTQIYNLYGPTEAAVDVTWWRCAPGDATPIGRPIANVEAHVLGPGEAPQPVGFAGEVHLGGACLARGYLNAPAATAAVFTPKPWAADPGARLYRTGDLGVRRADGALEHLGRIDRQVKIAGVRVEPAETEQVLRSVPAVADVACVAHPGPDGSRLIAYVVPANPNQPVDVRSLRAAVRGRLPAAFVPTAVISLPELPTTGSGKLDQSALPPPPATAAAERAPALPGTPLEQRIADIWGTVLGAGRAISVHEDFFAAGGDSLIAVSVVARLRSAGVPVTVAELVEARTVAAVAALARPRAAAPTPAPLPPFALCPPEHRAMLPETVEDAYPISLAQRAVLSRQLAGRSTAAGAEHEVYVTSVRVRGPFDAAALQHAADHVVGRHPYLRSGFDLAAEPEPLQLVHAPSSAPLTIIDIRSQPTERHDDVITAWVRDERTRPLDPTAGSLARFTAHRRSDADFQLTVSSFALDGWCTATILTELLTAHAAVQRGDTVLPPPLVGGYADFVALEMAARRSPEHRWFWDQQLAGASPCLIPARDRVPGHRLTRRHVLDVTPAMAERLRQIAADHGVPVKSVLLAAHLRVVREFAATDDVLTLLETNGRPEHHDGDRIVGVFNNLVPLRVRMPKGAWRDLLAAAWDAERAVLPHRRYPFASIDREHHIRALTNTLFVYTHFHVYGELAADPDIDLVDGIAPDQTYMPLTAHFNADARSGALRLLLDVDPARFTDTAARHLVGLYERALDALGSAPGEPWTARPLLTPATRRALVLTGRPAPPTGATLHALVLRQAEIAPDGIAVAAVDLDGAEQHLTYRGLDTASKRLAAALRMAGVGTDTLVALPARPSVEFVVGLLAILRAGGGYLPVELDDPAERVHRSLTAAGVRHAVAWDGTRLDLPPGCDAVHFTDAVHTTDAVTVPDTPGAGSGHPDALAYAMHTSGSTGIPKLIGVSHAAVVNYLRWCHTAYRPHTGRTVVHSRLSFDLTVTALLGPLTSGGTAVLPRHDPVTALPGLLPSAAGPLKITPAHLEALGWQLRATSGRPATAAVVVGGEQLLERHLRSWAALAPNTPVTNEYGPTETTVGCCAHRTTAAHMSERVPIGVPIDGMRAVVTATRGPAPPGTVGELHIGGVGVARGYLGDPALTAARFTPDPDADSARVYRTGDRAHLGDDGLLHYAGRADRQLKVRGFRVEPAEVEAVLHEHPRVHGAAVVGLPTRADQVRLVAYWAGPPGHIDLVTWLAGKLPAHMVPAEAIRLTALPLTANGKVDRAALADPDFARRHRALSAVEDLGPRTASQLLGLGGAAHE